MTFKEIILGFIQANKLYYNDLLRKKNIHSHKKIPAQLLYEKVHKEANLIFVLSTGRTGTLFLTNILKQHPKCFVEHEPQNELLYFSKYAYENANSKHNELLKIIDAARYETIRNCFLNDEIYVETNNRITFFAPQLAELYPNSKFIHLYRNPEQFVLSGLNRDWYTGKHTHDEGRIIHSDAALWETFSQEEKIAWLWNETNQFIEKFKTTLPSNRFLTLNSNALFKSKSIQKEVIQFIGLENFSFKTVKPVNKQKTLKSLKIDKDKIKTLTPLSSQYDF